MDEGLPLAPLIRGQPARRLLVPGGDPVRVQVGLAQLGLHVCHGVSAPVLGVFGERHHEHLPAVVELVAAIAAPPALVEIRTPALLIDLAPKALVLPAAAAASPHPVRDDSGAAGGAGDLLHHIEVEASFLVLVRQLVELHLALHLDPEVEHAGSSARAREADHLRAIEDLLGGHGVRALVHREG